MKEKETFLAGMLAGFVCALVLTLGGTQRSVDELRVQERALVLQCVVELGWEATGDYQEPLGLLRSREWCEAFVRGEDPSPP